MTSFFNITSEELKTSQPVRKSYFELGKSLYVHGMYEKAKLQFSEALSVNDDSVNDWQIYHALFNVCTITGKEEEARANFFRILATAPTNVGEELVRQAKQAGVLIEPLTSQNGKDELLLKGENQFLRYNDNNVVATLSSNDAMTIGASDLDKEIANTLATIENDLANDNIDKAEQQLQSLSITGSNQLQRQAQILNGRLLIRQQKIAEAIAIADKLISESANDITAFVLKIQALVSDRKYTEALSVVHGALAVYPDSPDLHFYKIEILIEGNINLDEGEKMLHLLKSEQGIEFLEKKLDEPHIKFRPQHGNDNFFLAQVYKMLREDFSVEEALRQADLALKEEVVFEGYNYPRGVIYKLKAELHFLEENYSEAVSFYYLGGKELYWNASYSQSLELFKAAYDTEKERRVQPPLIDNYYYYAENCVMLSYTKEEPFVDEAMIARASEIWYEAYDLQKPSFNNAWTYLTASTIHDQASKLPNRDKQANMLYSWIYAEHCLLIEDSNARTWYFLSQALTNNALYFNANTAAETAYLINKEDVYNWEQKAITLLNIGKWEEGIKFLEELVSKMPDDLRFTAWQGYAHYHLANYEKAGQIINDVILKAESWLAPRFWRLFLNWFTHNQEALMQDASWIWERRNNPNFKNLVTSEFAYAAYILGHEEEAIQTFNDLLKKEYDEKTTALFFFCIHHLLKKEDEAAKEYFDQYLSYCLYPRNFSELRNGLQAFRPDKIDWMEQVNEKLKSLEKEENIMLVANEITKYVEQHKGPLHWDAYQLTIFRIFITLREWSQGILCCGRFQQEENTLVDKFHVWNKFYTYLRNAILNKWYVPDTPEQLAQFASWLNESPYDNLTSLADLYAYLSVIKKEKNDSSEDAKQKAKSLYVNAQAGDAEVKYNEAVNSYLQLYPEAKAHFDVLPKSADEPFLCPNCRTEIKNPSQRFCFVCGNELHGK